MKEKQKIGVLIIVLMLAVGLVASFFPAGFFAPKDKENDGGEKFNFSQTGVLTQNNPGLKPNTWYLVYEKPGAPALTAELKIDSQSVCGYEEGTEVPCSAISFENGQPAKIIGTEEGETVAIRNLFIRPNESGGN